MRVWVLALLILPLAGASEAPVQPGIWNPIDAADVRLHFHINGVQDFPINTQAIPEGAYAQAQGVGVVTHSQGCVDNPVGVGASTHHTYYGYNSPGLVEYDFGDSGMPRYHPERGLTRDVILDADTPVYLDWYLQSQWFAGDADPDPNELPGYTPNVVVRATWREGDTISNDHAKFNSGRIIAQGQTEPAVLSPASELPDGVSHSMVDGNHVYHFRVPMGLPLLQKVDQREGMNVRVDVYVENPLCNDPGNDGYLMIDHVRVHTSDGHRPGMDVRIHHAIRIDSLSAVFEDDKLIVHAATSSPFGAYDRGTTRAAIVGGAEGEPLPPKPCYEHGCGYWTEDLAWTLESTGSGFVVLETTNLQETASATGILKFDMGDRSATACAMQGGQVMCSTSRPPPEETTPGFPVVFLLAALALLVRRR